jgi:hypothetical protein
MGRVGQITADGLASGQRVSVTRWVGGRVFQPCPTLVMGPRRTRGVTDRVHDMVRARALGLVSPG